MGGKIVPGEGSWIASFHSGVSGISSGNGGVSHFPVLFFHYTPGVNFRSYIRRGSKMIFFRPGVSFYTILSDGCRFTLRENFREMGVGLRVLLDFFRDSGVLGPPE